ncbi:hypothetical protein B296_00053870, partial [Ensete ventricosum]
NVASSRERMTPRGTTTPRSPAGRRGNALFTHWKTRRRLVPARGDEASPHCLVPARGYARYRPIVGDPHTGILSDRLVPPGSRNGEP